VPGRLSRRTITGGKPKLLSGMAPPASILFPTRRRGAYLAHALASVAPQAAACGAEVIVVEDDPADRDTEALAVRHGARYLALGAPRGINAARNAALETAAGDLLCLLDDDVEVWPGWLDALLAAAAACPEHEAFGGPIRPRLEGRGLRTCGREPVPITNLDLGPEDRDATFAWGANLAIRRNAIDRIGAFDPGLGGAGDEEDWQRRLRGAGGRIRYVAAAGVDHRRAGRDSTLRALAAAAFHRGRHARRWDARKGTAPPITRELRTLAGCIWHTARRRCANGIVLSALTAGRLREALAPAPAPPNPGDPEYLSGRSGTLSRRDRTVGAARDLLAAGAAVRTVPALRLAARRAPRRRVLAVIIARPEHARTTARLRRELARSRHDVHIVEVPPVPGAGKWANINAALGRTISDATSVAAPSRATNANAALDPTISDDDGTNPEDADWLLLVDDDVVVPRRFLDRFLVCAERYGFRLAQPAHAFASHAAWTITRRRRGLVARRTRFVEIGPVTAIHRDAFAALLPFPDLQMGWGLDNHWSALAAERGWPIGIVDATPVRHLRPVAGDYPREAAIAEAEAFLDGRAYVTRSEAETPVAEYR
jgi:GT2 family glycosyltransferase